MDKLRAPAALQFDVSNVVEAWRKWKMQFKTYFDATEVVKKPKRHKPPILLTVAGAEALYIFQTFALGKMKARRTWKPC